MGKYVLAVAALFLSVHAHAERKIYSCKDANGNAVFSADPCGKDAQEVHDDTGSRVPPSSQSSDEVRQPQATDTGADDVPKVSKKVHPAPQRAAPSGAIQDIADMNADNDES